MAGGTAGKLRGAQIVFIMAGAARFALFHVSHGGGQIVLADNMVNGVVAGGAVIIRVPEMVFVPKRYFPRLGRVKIERLLKISINANRNRQEKREHDQFY